MAKSSRTSGLAVGLAAVLLAGSVAAIPFPTRAQEPDRALSPERKVRPETRLVPQRQWEYRQLPCTPTPLATRERSDFFDTLNDSGRHGWELVSLVEVRQVPGRECLLATLKREIVN